MNISWLVNYVKFDHPYFQCIEKKTCRKKIFTFFYRQLKKKFSQIIEKIDFDPKNEIADKSQNFFFRPKCLIISTRQQHIWVSLKNKFVSRIDRLNRDGKHRRLFKLLTNRKSCPRLSVTVISQGSSIMCSIGFWLWPVVILSMKCWQTVWEERFPSPGIYSQQPDWMFHPQLSLFFGFNIISYTLHGLKTTEHNLRIARALGHRPVDCSQFWRSSTSLHSDHRTVAI